MTTETTTDIETETVTHSHVEHTVEVVEEEREVTTCEWCDGVHPIEETVAIGLGITTEERRLSDIPLSRGVIERAKGISAKTFHKKYDTASVVVESQQAQRVVPYCAWCANSVFGLDVESVLDAPAYEYYDQSGTDDHTADGGGGVSVTGVPSLSLGGWLFTFAAACYLATVLLVLIGVPTVVVYALLSVSVVAGLLPAYFA